jgi:hypothetical protein
MILEGIHAFEVEGQKDNFEELPRLSGGSPAISAKGGSNDRIPKACATSGSEPPALLCELS